MRLHEVMPDAPAEARELDVTGLAYDTRQVASGTLFFCVPGFTRDGHDFAPEAIARGAVALVVQRPLALGVPEVLVGDVRAAMAPAAAAFYRDPTRELITAGVTGTNGKTTTAFLLRTLLEAGGRQTGLLGTVLSVIGGVEHEVVRTTPEAIDLQRTFRGMLDAGDSAVAIFTNLTQDHLDFHGTMDDYFASKRRLFTESLPGAAVLNVDDPYGRQLAAELTDPITFALERDATYRGVEVQTELGGSRLTVVGPDDEVELTSPLRGRFNVYNVLGSFAAARALGVAADTIARAIANAGQVPGRFQPVDEGQDFAVLVDYAHTPDSLENVLRAARSLTAGRVHVVFGCGGDRDRGKRPLMGEIARRLADRVIVTSDNPRSEDPEAIIDEILAGAGTDVRHTADRRAAIAEAIAGAGAGDVVLIAGKGHEQGQEFAGGRKLPFDDCAVAREVLRGVVPTPST